MSEATCKTCPWWDAEDGFTGYCHHILTRPEDRSAPSSWWCNEHPDRKRPPIHEIARAAMAVLIRNRPDASLGDIASLAHRYANAMIAEWEHYSRQQP